MTSRHHQLFAAVALVLLVLGCGKAKPTKLEQAKQFLHKKDHTQALQLCNDLLKDDANNYEAMLLRGQVKESLGTKPEAMADFTRAIEMAPTKPDGYAFRYKLNIELAKQEQETDPDRSGKFEQAAIEDHRNYLRFSPSAADVAGLSTQIPQLKSLSKPIPGLEQPFEPPTLIDPLAATEFAPGQPNQEEIIEQQPELPTDDGQPAQPAQDQAVPAAPNQWLSNRAETLKRIQELDLRDSQGLLEPTLPPHIDPTQPELIPPEGPLPLITRFDIPPGEEIRPIPRKRRPTTGIVQLPEDQDMAMPDAAPFRPGIGSPTTSPFLSMPRSAPTTGIVSGRPEEDSAQARRDRGFGTITSLWAPWAPQSPRPGDQLKPQPDEDTPPATPTKPAQVVSMALPGTSPSTRDGQQTTGNKLVPAPWEKGYLPFKPRPTGFVTPSVTDR